MLKVIHIQTEDSYLMIYRLYVWKKMDLYFTRSRLRILKTSEILGSKVFLFGL